MTANGLAAALVACAAGVMLCPSIAAAQTQGPVEVNAEPSQVNREQPVAVADPRYTPESGTNFDLGPPKGKTDSGTFTFGGAFRVRYDWRFDDASRGGVRKARENFDFDTLALKATYDSDTIFGSAQYRFQGGSSIYGPSSGYRGHPGEVSFPMWAYLGYKFTPEDSLTFGLNQSPFGLTPYFGTSFIATLGFATGVEEVYNLGVKFSHVEPDFNYQVGFYPGANPNAVGLSLDSARYSTAIVRADPYVTFGTNNAEQNMFIGRAEYFVLKNDDASLALGASIWHSDIYNFDTRQTGTKQLGGVHALGTYDAWSFKAIYIRQDIDPRNPFRNDLVTVGGFDFSYNLAARGNFVSAEVTYKVPDPIGPFTVVPFVGYSAFYKDKADFRASERFILGGAWTLMADPNLIIYTEAAIGRNDPYVGVGEFNNGLAQGGENRFKSRFIMNIGYYF